MPIKPDPLKPGPLKPGPLLLLTVLSSFNSIGFAEPEPSSSLLQQAGGGEMNKPEAGVVDKSDPKWKQNLHRPALMSFEEGKSYYWDMKTNKGDMSFKLFHQSAPMHATSTIYLTELGFYDDVVFHRVIPGFMAQGGDPTGTGRGGPGYQYKGEFDGSNSHNRAGLLSMANAGPNTDGSQFFITFAPTVSLDGKHTIFGELIDGRETLGTLAKLGSRSGRTIEILKINKATIRVE